MLTWDSPNERYYEHGIDRGVLYIPGKDPVVWNGLTGVDEGSEVGASTVLYRDGIIYLSDVDASDYSGKLTSLFFPDEFSECIGMPMATDGLFVDNQKPKRFGLSYRSLVGSGGENDRFGYRIHLLYNVMASIGTRSRRTLGKSTDPIEFGFDLVATPVKLAGFRPTAHYILDTRFMSQDSIRDLENILYGDGTNPGSLPAPSVLYDMLNFGDAITVIDHGDGTMTIRGSNANVHELDSATAEVKNINATELNGDITISDGGNTTIVAG